MNVLEIISLADLCHDKYKIVDNDEAKIFKRDTLQISFFALNPNKEKREILSSHDINFLQIEDEHHRFEIRLMYGFATTSFHIFSRVDGSDPTRASDAMEELAKLFRRDISFVPTIHGTIKRIIEDKFKDYTLYQFIDPDTLKIIRTEENIFRYIPSVGHDMRFEGKKFTVVDREGGVVRLREVRRAAESPIDTSNLVIDSEEVYNTCHDRVQRLTDRPRSELKPAELDELTAITRLMIAWQDANPTEWED